MLSPIQKTKLRNRDNWWQKYWHVVSTGVHGCRKKVSTIECKLCHQEGKRYKILSVRSRNIRHLEKAHGLSDPHPNVRKRSDGQDVSSNEFSASDSTMTSTSPMSDFDDSRPAKDSNSRPHSNSLSETSEVDDDEVSIPSSPLFGSPSPVPNESNATHSPVEIEHSTSSKEVKEVHDASLKAKGTENDAKFASSFSPSSQASSNVASSCSQPSSPQMSEFEQERTEYLFAAWCYSCNLPPTTFDVPFFREALHVLNPSFRPPSSEIILPKMNQILHNMKVLEAAQKLCLLASSESR